MAMPRKKILDVAFLHQLQNDCGGSIPFERFMKEALYHPDFGYYSTNIRNVGSGGDFSTSTTLNDDMAAAIALWIRARAKDLRWPRIPIIEIGAGNGSLASTIMRHLGWKFRLSLDYMIYETSHPLRNLQKQKLRWRGVRWIESIKQGLYDTGGRALIFSNELVDAFPCQLFERTMEGWAEIGVKLSSSGSLTETIVALDVQDPWFEQVGAVPIGQRVERHDSYRIWLNDWSPHWRSGSILTIDYGGIAGTLYQRRPHGSVRAYRHHERIIGTQVYARFGRQDLTADVNFSDLISWGSKLGWKTVSLVSQREFLQSQLIRGKTLLSENQLRVPGIAEDAFSVLEQSTDDTLKR